MRIKMYKYIKVYLTTNTVNGKTYIGQHAFNDNADDGYIGSGKAILKAIRKYGKDKFTIETLALTSDDTIANILEQYFISEYKKIGKAEYNIAAGGVYGGTKYLSDEAKLKLRKKLSASHKGHIPWHATNKSAEISRKCYKIVELNMEFIGTKEIANYLQVTPGAITNSIARGNKIKGKFTIIRP